MRSTRSNERRRSGSANAADAELVARAQAGSQSAFTDLVLRHRRRVLGLCRSITGNASDADDAVQEALLQAYRRLGSFRRESQFSTWLHRIAFNAAHMHLRKQRRQLRITSEVARVPVQRSVGADTLLHQRRVAAAAVRALDELPTSYSQPFRLFGLADFDVADTAAELGLSKALVRQRLSRARVKLRGRLTRLEAA